MQGCTAALTATYTVFLRAAVYSQKLSKNDLPGFIIVRKVAGENTGNGDRRGGCLPVR